MSGTIKKAEEEAIRRARISILRAQRASNGRTAGAVALVPPNGEGSSGAADDEYDDGGVDLSMLNGIEDPDEPGDMDDDDDG